MKIFHFSKSIVVTDQKGHKAIQEDTTSFWKVAHKNRKFSSYDPYDHLKGEPTVFFDVEQLLAGKQIKMTLQFTGKEVIGQAQNSKMSWSIQWEKVQTP
eukprot:UN01727